MTPNTTLPVRTICLPDRLEFHAEACAHRVPRGAEVHQRDWTVQDLRDTFDEAVALNDVQPVKPCLRRVIR